MDNSVYQQVIVTCTTMNTVYFVTFLITLIADGIRDRRKKKEREEAAEREAAEQ